MKKMAEEIKNEKINEENAAAEVSAEANEESEEPRADETPVIAASDVEDIGNIKICVDVVSTIAGIAASEIKGVAGMYSSFANGIAEKFGAKKNQSKGVKVEMGEDAVTIDLYIVVKYGIKIPELAWEVQESVKNNVETMTGLEVAKVNIQIEGVSFSKDSQETELAHISEEEEN